MRILLDIGHPAHVHLYRNFYHEMVTRGHEITVTVKEIPSAVRLLELYNIPYINIGKPGNTIKSKGFNQLKFNYALFLLAWRGKFKIALGSSITNCHVSRLSPMYSVVFDDDDDEVQPLMAKFGHPFAHCLLSPDALSGKRRRKDTVYYSSYHELAYLHPSVFTPDISVLKEAGLNENDDYFIMRFNAFKAHHDIGIKGLSLENKITLAKFLSEYGKVFITTEKEIEPELKEYQLKVPPHKIHSLLSRAKIFIGDSQTMTSEAAVLGIPALRCNSFAGRISYLEEQEKRFGLAFSYQPEDFERLFFKLRELIGNPNLKNEWQEKRLRMLNEKIDLTGFMVWFVENYPGSWKTILMDNSFQYKFLMK